MANLRATAVVVLSMLAVVWSRDLTFDAAELSPAMTQDSALSDADMQEMADSLKSLVQSSLQPHAAEDVETVEMVEMMRGLLEKLEQHITVDILKADNAPLSGTDDADGSCQCSGSSCSCCAKIDLHVWKPNCCAKVAYIPSQRAIVLVLTIDGNVILRKTLSVIRPPPLCLKYNKLSLCLKFSNIGYTDRRLSACMDVEASFKFFKKTIRLGCFEIRL